MALDMIIIKWYVPMVQLRIVRRTKNATQLNHFHGISHMTAMVDAVRQVSLNIQNSILQNSFYYNFELSFKYF